MSEAFTGEIRMFAGNYAPEGWALCAGQLMSVQDYQALFSLLGTTYGGDGISQFGLPDLRGRVPVGIGQGQYPAASAYTLGQAFGIEQVTLQEAQLPAHNHAMQASSATATQVNATNNVLATTTNNTYATYTDANKAIFNTKAVGASGANLPHTNMMPTTAINFIICLQNLYPPHPN